MNDKRSIQDIIPPARSKPIRKAKKEETEGGSTGKLPPRPRRERRKGGVITLLGIALVVIVVIAGAFGVVSTVFHRADVTITPHAFSVTIAESYEAAPNGELLSYTTSIYEETASKDVQSTDSEFVEERAEGVITIFNEYSGNSQRLITNTRFESPEGLIYRVRNPVTVPGYTTSGGRVIPGSIDVTVYADEPGERYNTAATRFTIPGLRGTAQFDGMYAESDSAIQGGFVGEKAIVDESVKDAAMADLKRDLSDRVKAGLEEQLGANQIFSPSLITVDFIEQLDRVIPDGAQVAVKAVASAPAFSQSQVAELLASEGGVVFDSPLRIQNIQELSLEIAESETEGNLVLTISGVAELQAIFDQDQFVREIAGKDQESVGAILTGYPGIKDLNLSVYPFWRQTLPGDVSQFSITVDE